MKNLKKKLQIVIVFTSISIHESMENIVYRIGHFWSSFHLVENRLILAYFIIENQWMTNSRFVHSKQNNQNLLPTKKLDFRPVDTLHHTFIFIRLMIHIHYEPLHAGNMRNECLRYFSLRCLVIVIRSIPSEHICVVYSYMYHKTQHT